MVQRIKRAERRRRQGEDDRGFVYTRAVARLPRLGEVTLSEAPGEPPTYAVEHVRIYGLGPPPPPTFPRGPSADWVGKRLASLLPRGLEMSLAEDWREEGLRFRIVHPATQARVWGAVPRLDGVPLHETRDAVFEVLGEALERLRDAVNEAHSRSNGETAPGP